MPSTLLEDRPARSQDEPNGASAPAEVEFPLGTSRPSRALASQPRWLPEGDALSPLERKVGRSGGLTFEPYRGDTDPVRRTQQRTHDLLAQARTAAEVGVLLGATADEVRHSFDRGVLYAVLHDGERLFPAFQFSHFGLLPGAAEVWPLVPRDLSLVAVARWFEEPCIDLVVRGEALAPQTWLRDGGEPGAVAALARHL